jgi:hypothetical protein
MELEFIIHGRLEVQLDAVYIILGGGIHRAIDTASCNSNGWRTTGSRTWRGWDVVRESWARLSK